MISKLFFSINNNRLMESLRNKIVTKIVFAVKSSIHNDGEIVVIVDQNNYFDLLRTNTIKDFSFYERAFCYPISTDSVRFVVNVYNSGMGKLPLFGSILIDDLEYNHVNDHCENHCLPSLGESEFSVHLQNAAITFFVTDTCKCITGFENIYRYFHERESFYYFNTDKQIILTRRDGNFFCSCCNYFVCTSITEGDLNRKDPALLLLVLKEFLQFNSLPEDIKHPILLSYHYTQKND